VILAAAALTAASAMLRLTRALAMATLTTGTRPQRARAVGEGHHDDWLCFSGLESILSLGGALVVYFG
jgi:hypothetical protein